MPSTPALRRIVPTTAVALAALGALAGCAGDQNADAQTGSGASSSDSGATSSASGTWTESGDYQTPGGTETVEVKLTAENGKVTAVEVTGSGHNQNSQKYQGAFASGISGEVVGKDLATLKVGAVSGSSLTGNGFNAAVEKIRADAA